MKKITKISFITAITLTPTLYASSVTDMFTNAKVGGNVRSIYSQYNNENDKNSYATAVGGQLKYELAKYKGLNGAVTFTTSHDIDFATGEKSHKNDELSGTKGSYTEATEAYIDYERRGFTIRVGRQLIDTPLADSDDVRMVPNTFEAYIATYEMNGFSLMAGHLNQWQGADAGVDEHWVKTGKDGVNFGGLNFSNDFVEANLWYYNITGSNEGNNAIYLDLLGKYSLNDIVTLQLGVQYLNESELDNSNVEANIYGAMAEMDVDALTFVIAYNGASKERGKTSFSGYGGGTLFTSMDTMILDEITTDRDAQAIVAGVSYELNALTLSYAYGDFQGDADTSGVKAHIVEQDISLEYKLNEEFTFGAIYVIDDNQEQTKSQDFNDQNFRASLSYNF